MLINIIHLSEAQVQTMDMPSFAIGWAIEEEKRRRQSYLEQMSTQWARYKVWNGVIAKPTFTAISRAHKRIVEDAKKNSQPRVCIMESDAIFTCDRSLKFFMEQMPASFDMYSGVLYSGNLGEKNRLLNGGSAILTFYVLDEKFYDTFLDITENDHLDRQLGQLAKKHEIILCYPYPVYQPAHYSFNHRRHVNYEGYLRDRAFFE